MRRLAIAEVVVIVGLVLAIIWIVKPRDLPFLDLSLRTVIVVLLVGSAVFHGDSRQRLGLRVDTVGPALARILPLTLLAAGVCLAAGAFLGSILPPRRLALELAYYFGWAVAQQYALQAVVLQRLQDAGLGARAPLVAASLFSLVHAPNPGLMILTFLGAGLWCSTFQKYPNLLAVALGHSILAVIVASTLPPAVTGGYRLGPSYLRR